MQHKDSNTENSQAPSKKLTDGTESIVSVFLGALLALGIVYVGANKDQTHKASNTVLAQGAGGGENIILGAALDGNMPKHNGLMCAADSSGVSNSSCLIKKAANACTVGEELCEADVDIGKVAWKYFENNYQPETGLVNSVNNFKSTTLWDTGSALAATIAAYDFGYIDKKDFDDRIMALLKSLTTMELFDDAAPNKVYNTKTLKMVDYANKEKPDGIGVSVLDMARLMSWMNTLACMHPKYYSMVGSALSRWDYKDIIKDDRMWGLARDKKDPKKIKILQEGRLGYEQYAAKIFRNLGFDVDVAASYENEYRGNIEIMGVDIAYDTRDPRDYHANNYVVTESYTMDAMELGLDRENTNLVRNIFEVQKRRWQDTGIVTAISEDNINQSPWFLYNTIFNAGLPWQTTNSSDVKYDHLKTVSVKAAMTMAILYPEDEYSAVLSQAIESAYDPEKGWYSGIYENGAGYNTVVTANTNGVILQSLLYKKYGALFPHCENCSKLIDIESDVKKPEKIQTSCISCDLPH